MTTADADKPRFWPVASDFTNRKTYVIWQWLTGNEAEFDWLMVVSLRCWSQAKPSDRNGYKSREETTTKLLFNEIRERCHERIGAICEQLADQDEIVQQLVIHALDDVNWHELAVRAFEQFEDRVI